MQCSSTFHLHMLHYESKSKQRSTVESVLGVETSSTSSCVGCGWSSAANYDMPSYASISINDTWAAAAAAAPQRRRPTCINPPVRHNVATNPCQHLSHYWNVACIPMHVAFHSQFRAALHLLILLVHTGMPSRFEVFFQLCTHTPGFPCRPSTAYSTFMLPAPKLRCLCRRHFVVGSVRLWVSLCVQKPCEHHISKAVSREYHPISVTDVLGFIDVLISFDDHESDEKELISRNYNKYGFNPFNSSCSKLLLFKEFSAILV